MRNETLVHVFWERVRNTPARPAILHKVAGSYRPVIWREHGRVVELAVGGLLSLSVAPGEKVGILSNSRPQWTWADLSILSAAAVTVPIFPTLAAPEVDYLLRHSDSVGLFVENDRQLAKVLSQDELPPKIRFLVLMDGDPPGGESRVRILRFDDLLKDGEVYLPNHPEALSKCLDLVKPNSLATIVYTSGTTGVPKGAMLLHRNIYAVCQSLSLLVGFTADDLSLSFLPLAHVYERIGGQFLAIYEGLVMAYAEAMEMVIQNLNEVRPTVLNGVPRFFEKVYNRIKSEVRQMPKPQQYLIRWALALGRRAAKYNERAIDPADELVRKFYRTELRVAERLVFSKIRRRFGARLRFMVSGAAPLSSEVQLFFDTIGINVIEGYGLTETAAPVTCNTPNGKKRGTVGRVLPGLEVQCADDGEIMVRGRSVFSGYYKNPHATSEAFRDGWFLTGDIGEFDQDGFLRIKDRKKDLIVTAGGKKVAPQFLENLFVGEGLISRIVVYGDRRKYITALVTLSPDEVTHFARDNGMSFASADELMHHPMVLREVESLIERKNQRLASYEQIKKFLILDHDLTVEANELTPTLKVKRKVVNEKYSKLLDSLYAAEDLEVEDSAQR